MKRFIIIVLVGLGGCATFAAAQPPPPSTPALTLPACEPLVKAVREVSYMD